MGEMCIRDRIDSAEYCLTYAKPGGGYFFCTSNVPFHGMPPERYLSLIHIYLSRKKDEMYDRGRKNICRAAFLPGG